MGRRKIDIAPISNDRHRNVTFSKRKSGLIKKATELSVLCDAQVAVLVFSAGHKVTCYSSNPINHLLQRFSEYKDTPEVRSLPPLVQPARFACGSVGPLLLVPCCAVSAYGF
jgi:MADS-box transcription factor